MMVPQPEAAARAEEVEASREEPAPPAQSHTQSEPPAAPLSELEEAREEIARQHALFKRAVEECERVKANATHVQAELKRFQADRQQLKADVAHARQTTQAAESHASELAVALATVQQEYTDLRVQMEAEFNGLHGRIAALDQALHERDAQLGNAVRNLTKAKSDLSASIVEAGGLRSELEAHQYGLQTTGHQLTAAKTELNDAITRLGSLTGEYNTAVQLRDQWKERADGFERDLSAIDSGRDLLELRTRFKKLEEDYQALQTKFNDHAEEAEKNSNALNGIVSRQNTTLGVYHSELRRLRRARFGVRLAYSLFFLALVGLGFFAVKTISPKEIPKLIHSLKNLKSGSL